MAINPQFITGVELEEYFVDKNTGAPLAGGVVTFYQDSARTTPKLVYTIDDIIVGGLYTYSALPNPIILSSVGTIMDAAGNNVPIYYFPYDANGNTQLYYITVTDSVGNEQFTRVAWPNISPGQNPNIATSEITNAITNPQFALINFANPDTITLPIGTTTVAIAPGWTLTATATVQTTVTVTQNSITGVQAAVYPFNPPYTLTITPGANITSLFLTQRLNNNPNIFSPQTGGMNGYIAATILLAPASSATINYVPSSAPAQQLLSVTNNTASYQQESNTVQLLPAANADNSNVGYVNINIVLSNTNPTTLGNVQIVGLQSNIQDVLYDQTTVNQQTSDLFYYFNPQLAFKPINSYLVGWDFPVNPAQFLTSTVGAFATGANTSNYVWDQTIVFQTTNSGFTTSRAPNGDLRLTAAANTQLALIQYLGVSEARSITQNDLSVMITALTNMAAGINTKVTLWYTTGGSLPNMGANASIVATLDATGRPATFNGAWIEITRNNLGDAAPLVAFSPIPLNYGFSGWNANDTLGTAANAVTFFAIVVGTTTLTATNYIDFRSVSLVPGKVPTIPAIKTTDEVLRECRKFWRSSFQSGTVPATGAGINSGCVSMQVGAAAGSGPTGGQNVYYESRMRATPNLIFYNPVSANAQAYNTATGRTGDCSGTTFHINTNDGMAVSFVSNGTANLGDNVQVHVVSEARYGIV